MFTNTNSFQKSLYLLTVGLVGLCIVFTALTWVQGVRVRSASINDELAVTKPNQRLLLQLNQLPGAIGKEQVAITPNVPFSVVGGGKTIAIQFTQPLNNATKYTVRVRMAHNRSFSYSFETRPTTMFYLVTTGSADEIRRRLPNGKDEVVFSGEGIKDYVVIKDKVIIVQKVLPTQDRLLSHTIGSKTSDEIKLSEPGIVTALQAAPDGKSFGFEFTTSDYRSDASGLTLYTLADKKLQRVVGLNNKPVNVNEWYFARDSTTILAQTLETDTLLLSRAKLPVPLGQYIEVGGFNFDDSSIFARNNKTGYGVLNLHTMQQDDPIVQPDELSYVLSVKSLHTQNGYVTRLQSYRDGHTVGSLTVSRQQSREELYHTVNPDEYINTYSVSPNDQYAAVEIRTGGRDYTTHVVDSDNKKIITTMAGGKVRWPVY